jgi:predicted ribosome quality control (RQC) complex YloA/Tae2 family protein
MTAHLNWKELEILTKKVRPEVEGLFVDRVIVPERSQFPGGYIKGEWAIRLTGRRQEGVLLISIRPRHPYLAFCYGKGSKASSLATRSPFDLNLSKYLKGAKLLELKTLPQERIAVLWFSDGGDPSSRLGLILVFIPSAPEAFLVSAHESDLNLNESNWIILARSRTIRDESKQSSVFKPPSGAQAPQNPVVRNEFFETEETFFRKIEKDLELEAYQLRTQNAEKSLKDLIKQAQERIRQSETALKEAEKEENWQRFGDLLKSAFGSQPELNGKVRKVTDFETDQEVEIPCDPKLSLKDQVEKFYQSARRKQRRMDEARIRIQRFTETTDRLESILKVPLPPLDWKALERLETAAGRPWMVPEEGKKQSQKAPSAWLGKTFTSSDGASIWVGRSKDENLELSFKQARGNDLWMHIRGKPGAHVVIPIQPGKSASLETLLDAAHLAIYYSGGQNWGKTEVDYTFKKYVKRIKDSSEASYTHNKTLLVTPDPVRIQRLLDKSI